MLFVGNNWNSMSDNRNKRLEKKCVVWGMERECRQWI